MPQAKLATPSKKKGQLQKPNKHLMLFVGVEKPNAGQIETLHVILDWAMEHGCMIVTTDNDGVSAEVIRHTNAKKYRRVLVWGARGTCRYFSSYGNNHYASYQERQRDDCCVARTGAIVAIGKNKRLQAMVTFATNLGRKVVQK